MLKKGDRHRALEYRPTEKRCTRVDDRDRRRMSSAYLLGGGRELFIEHLGEIYVLRHTSKGKLILTK